MRSFLKGFASNQDGAISVEWVVLTASVIGLTVLLLGVFSDSIDLLVEHIRVQLAS